MEILKEILHNHEAMNPGNPPHVVFNEFKDWSLNIRMVYSYQSADEWKHLAFAEQVNLEILRRFNEEAIAFAFPTTTTMFGGDDLQRSAAMMAEMK